MRTFTEEQMELWGTVNLFVGCVAITAAHMIVLLLGSPSLDWVWQGLLLVVLVPMGYLYYRKYQQTKENLKNEPTIKK